MKTGGNQSLDIKKSIILKTEHNAAINSEIVNSRKQQYQMIKRKTDNRNVSNYSHINNNSSNNNNANYNNSNGLSKG